MTDVCTIISALSPKVIGVYEWPSFCAVFCATLYDKRRLAVCLHCASLEGLNASSLLELLRCR